jgi:Cu+-exporting ATPase
MDQITNAVREIDLSITGMTCASCVSRVEKSLSRVEGVRHVAVNLATETARVEAADNVTPASLIAAVDRAGYAATSGAPPPPRDRRELFELIAAAVLSAPLLLTMVLPFPGWLALLLATPVQFWLGARFHRAGWNALRHGSGNMDLLVALGTSAAYFLSLADFLRGAGPLYFESAAIVITLIRLGKYFEGQAKRDAAQAITGLNKLRPATAHLVVGTGIKDVKPTGLHAGDMVEIRPGERVPVDGVITTGIGSLDESHITGESLPVPRAAGAAVLAGALNLDSVLRIRATTSGGETLLDRMGRLIAGAQASKPQVQRLADRVSAVFVPVVVVLAVITLAGWWLAGAAPATAIINAVSVLVIACPCALGLATPAAILASTAAAARHGILIRNADALEHAARVNLVVFDKTGTLTMGTPKLVQTRILGDVPEERISAIAAALAASDTHPLSAALRQPGISPAESLRSLPGRGVEGRVDGARYLLGSAALIAEAGGHLPNIATPPGATMSYLALADGTPLAAFAFADSARPEAAAAIARLRGMGCDILLLTGDGEGAARAIGAELGITDIIAQADPAKKLGIIKARREAGFTVAMVGDGVNDAAALAAANVGIAIGAGADVAIEAADISLLRPDTMLVAASLSLSRKGWNVLREGLFWAIIYNVVGIPLAACGILSPMVAGAAMAASSVSVLANALRLRNWRPA